MRAKKGDEKRPKGEVYMGGGREKSTSEVWGRFLSSLFPSNGGEERHGLRGGKGHQGSNKVILVFQRENLSI